MKVSQDILERNSEEEFCAHMERLRHSGVGLVHVRARETVRATVALRKMYTGWNARLKEWNVQHGFREFSPETINDLNVSGDDAIDPNRVLRAPMEYMTDPSATAADSSVFIYISFHHWMENNPIFVHMMEQYASVMPAHGCQAVFVTPDQPLPDAVADLFSTVRFAAPGHVELRRSLEAVSQSAGEGVLALTEEDKDRLCFAGAGMSLQAFETFTSLGVVTTVEDKCEAAGDDDDVDAISVSADDLSPHISIGKTEIVNSNDLLELYSPESMGNVGGFENLKAWIRKRKECFTEEAREFGIEHPRGILSVGISGSGKSLMAKAISSEWGVPLIRFDFGRIFNSLVGKSEERMRTALAMVESMAPCVLWADEIEKGLAGVGGGNDSGTSSRVLGTYLTWLQENKAPVFTIATANNIEFLPPELLRRGRFDATFASLLPDDEERMEILNIHLKRRNQSRFKSAALAPVIKATNGFVGAEIESLVRDALVECFSSQRKLSVNALTEAAGSITPLSKSHSVAVQAITAWAHANAISAGKPFNTSRGLKERVALTPARRRLTPDNGGVRTRKDPKKMN